MASPKHPLELERNDLDGAIETYRAAVMNAQSIEELGATTQILISLQDDPEHLENAIDRVAAEPAVAAALAKLAPF